MSAFSFVNKIIARYFISEADGNHPSNGPEKAQMSILDTNEYNKYVKSLDNNEFQKSAGVDISNIFFPFKTEERVVNSVMPCYKKFDNNLEPGLKNVGTIYDLNPYLWERGETTELSDRYDSDADADHMSDVLSNDFNLDTSRYRDNHNIRGIGLRLPMMGVGWGLTARNALCMPSGTTVDKWHGDVPSGCMVNPDQYVAAPVDMRYDESKGVWTAPRGFWAKITGKPSGVVTDEGWKWAYPWTSLYPYITSTDKRPGFIEDTRFGGTHEHNPLYEVNHRSNILPNSRVWVDIKDCPSGYIFDSGHNTRFLAKLNVDSILITNARWIYGFSEVAASGNDFIIKQGGKSGTAMNSMEAFHVAEPAAGVPWYIWGVNVHGSGYPTNFKPKPIGGGHDPGSLSDSFTKYGVVVEITEVTDINQVAGTRYVFSMMGSHDGTC